ncbi:hypothetical protein Ait01nite_100830 [Actinoplanes italicus]|uniref:ATP-grasp domain-containing protein n=1 Tax=Actinoplanes italicus TaxID=113567 RepID=A0A2T0JB31_9ACTN|nr:hypothetical protein [Actinoplanes italicus]PRX04719.1 hypothetical protein CLV67_1475 [Actinoplanes italicus]GIE37038.1 hypothetical protein Ait01nite_100830 [Actinoplanes italicus]
MRQPRHVAILSLQNDLHALLVQRELRDRHDIVCDIVATDRLSGSSGLSWSDGISQLPTRDGGLVDVRRLDLIWLRRFNVPQIVPDTVTDPAQVQVIRNDCHWALLGLLLTDFRGGWISDPQATRAADNKLVQLRVAQQCGLRVPRTLISQDPEQIRRFHASARTGVIVKTIKGGTVWPLVTARMLDEHLAAEESMRLAPAIYQEYVPGTRHLRVLMLGETAYPVLIETDDLDWRPNLNVPVRETRLPADLTRRLGRVLHRLRLRMGVFDIKIDDTGEPVWLELNPQGQFLFVQGLIGMDLVTPFAEFVRRELPAREHVLDAS